MNSRAEIIDKARKIKALAERGIAGEKTAAQDALKRYCEKYGLDPEKIQPDVKFTRRRGQVDFQEFIRDILKNENLSTQEKAVAVLIVGAAQVISDYILSSRR